MAAILLADDDDALREFVSRALIAEGHAVVGVEDGLEALQQLERTKFDLLVSDLDMPVLDGMALASRATARIPDMKVLLISGLGEELKRADGLPQGRVTTLNKPFTLDQLRASVRALLVS